MKLADFECTDWRIERKISDHKTGSTAAFHGTAQIQKGQYYETGELTLPCGVQLHSERRYIWHDHEDGIEVLFDDGRPFHIIGFQTQDGETQNVAAAHFCDPDQYDVTYDFSNWPEWTAVWRVTGPRKDYTMQSRYRKHDAAPLQNSPARR